MVWNVTLVAVLITLGAIGILLMIMLLEELCSSQAAQKFYGCLGAVWVAVALIWVSSILPWDIDAMWKFGEPPSRIDRLIDEDGHWEKTEPVKDYFVIEGDGVNGWTWKMGTEEEARRAREKSTGVKEVER
jgi:hypothetical protein